MDAFLYTASLSQKTLAHPSIGIPDILNLHRKDVICSVAILRVTNSDPKVELSTVVCFLENYDIGALLRHTMTPVCDLLAMRSPA